MQSEENIIEIYAEADCTVQPVEYSIEDLRKIFKVERRQIQTYSAIICKANWEPESVFKPSFGKFSIRMLAEMKRLKSMGTAKYRKQCAIKSGKPSTHKIESALVISPTVAISNLDSKIAGLQQSSVVNSANLADRVRGKFAEIAQTNQLAGDRNRALNEAQMLAADNEGIEEALEIHARRISARNATLAQLKAMELENPVIN
jgi:hypothetical protein